MIFDQYTTGIYNERYGTIIVATFTVGHCRVFYNMIG